ncbi:MAG: hypothetical protein UZ05_CHB002000782 [Chlorobi bacterium OLB5]|nr:MAG: hypothetical protein UZ05_CHB002000782 [Chlorobi bacterium OLB5]
MKTTTIIIIIIFSTLLQITGCGSDDLTGGNKINNIVYENDLLVNYKDNVNDTISLWSGSVNASDKFKISMYVFSNDSSGNSKIYWGTPWNGIGSQVTLCGGNYQPGSIDEIAEMQGTNWYLTNCDFKLTFRWSDGMIDSSKWIKLTNIKIEKLD